MSTKNITIAEALERLKRGENIAGLSIDLMGGKVKALDAYNLGKAGIEGLMK